MIKKTITFENFDGEQVTEEHYFHLTRKELVGLDSTKDGGLLENIEKLMVVMSDNEIFNLFNKIILDAYGKKSPDGNRFIKNEELRTEFEQSLAYDELFVELISDTDKMIEFVKGIVPKNALDNLPEDFDDRIKKDIEAASSSE